MRTLSLIAHISLDGFVAGVNGELTGFESGEENLQFVGELTESADTCLYGRKTYELLDTYWRAARDLPDATPGQITYSDWYNGAKKIVVSRTLSGAVNADTTIVSNNIIDFVGALKQQQGRDILVFGSPAVSRLLMRHHLIDSYWIFVNPVLFGKGLPLFSGELQFQKLQLKSIKKFANGELALHYNKKGTTK